MKERERRNRLQILMLIRIEIVVLPTDSVALWVEHRRDKPRTWVQILASVCDCSLKCIAIYIYIYSYALQ